MALVARDGDPCGGTIQATATRCLVNGRPVARVGDRVTNHGDDHNGATLSTAGSAGRFVVEGKPVAVLGTGATCGHKVSQGSVNVEASV